MLRHKLFLICLLGLFIAGLTSMALGQDPATADATVEVVADWPARIEAGLLTWLPRIMALASIATAIFPSTGVVMRLIDVFAVSWGRARNDPKIQNWG